MQNGRDYHIHTHYMKCGVAAMTIEAVYRRCEEVGLKSIAITDHLNRREQAPTHLNIRKDMAATPTKMETFFGVELNILDTACTWPCDEAIMAEIGFQFAIGGVHGTWIDQYDLDLLVNRQHELLCRCAADPLIDVVVHPWWFGKGEFDKKKFPWFNDLSVVPEKLSREFARVAKVHNTAIEINASAIFTNPAYSPLFKQQYKDYVRVLNDAGVTFSMCSDAHHLEELGNTKVVEDLFSEIGVPQERIWHPLKGKRLGKNA